MTTVFDNKNIWFGEFLVVKICLLYKNVQNRLQDQEEFDGVRKLLSKHSFQTKFKVISYQ